MKPASQGEMDRGKCWAGYHRPRSHMLGFINTIDDDIPTASSTRCDHGSITVMAGLLRALRRHTSKSGQIRPSHTGRFVRRCNATTGLSRELGKDMPCLIAPSNMAMPRKGVAVPQHKPSYF